MTPDRPTGPATLTDNFGLPVTNSGQIEHSRQHRAEQTEHALFGYCDTAQRVKRIEVEQKARIFAALPAALANALPDHTKAIGFDHAASSCGAGCAAALVAAIEKVLESTPTEPVVTD